MFVAVCWMGAREMLWPVAVVGVGGEGTVAPMFVVVVVVVVGVIIWRGCWGIFVVM